MAVALASIYNGAQFFDNNGQMLSGGLLYTYQAGSTSVLQPTYTSSTGLVLNTNPIVLNSSGHLTTNLWLDVALNYNFVLVKSDGVTVISTVDNVPGGYNTTANTLQAQFNVLSAQQAALAASQASLVTSQNALAASQASLVTQFNALKFYDITGGTVGSPGISAVILTLDCARAISFPIGMTGSAGIAGTAATASTVFNLNKNGVSFGTMTFAAAGTVATFAAAVATSFAIGDKLTVTAPAVVDATLANIGFTLVAAVV